MRLAAPARPGPGTPPRFDGAIPSLSFDVPSDIVSRLRGAAERGAAEAREWMADHPDGDESAFCRFVAGQVGGPPEGADATADLDVVRGAARVRDAARDDQARWVDEYGTFDIWSRRLEEVEQTLAPAQAAAGRALLVAASSAASGLTFPVKDAHTRERPFQVDPSGAPLLDGVTHVRGGSYPSGHASNAWAAVAVLSALAPARAAQFEHDAEQVCLGRVYAAAHFPADVVSGAYLGGAAAAWAQSHA